MREMMAVGAGTNPQPGTSAPTLAEQLSPWLAWTDAIALSRVWALDTRAASVQVNDRPALQAALAKLQLELSQTIDALDVGDAADEAPWRQLWQVQQQTMAARIAPLRAQVRHAAARRGGALAQLAAMDAVLETALSARERSLLGGVPKWLQQQAGPDARGHVHALMRAELALRLQPVEGLLAALRPEGLDP